jgi:hypothetical protein
MLTEARVRAGWPCRTSASKSSGVAQAEVGDGSAQGVPGHLDPTARLVAVLHQCYRGQRGPVIAGGVELQGRLLTGGDFLGEIPARARWGLREADLGSILGMGRSFCGGSGGM